jgi:transcriptional regulator with XRE-family HTH domain
VTGKVGDDGRLAALGAYIRDHRRRAELSMRGLAELAGISNPYLSQIERGLRKPSAEILQQLARALSIAPEALYVQAGILERRSGDVDVIGEILRDGSLTPEQRDALVEAYRTYRAEAGAPLPEDDGEQPPAARR